MSHVKIYVHNTDRLGRDPDWVGVVEWAGEVDWPGAPQRGDIWFHCGDWAGETFHRVSFNAPTTPGSPGMDVEVRTDSEVIHHLIAEHGFTP